MAAVGKILRFDEVKGYGFIAPANGGDDVFVHANDFGELKHLVRPGLRVEYEAEVGERGLKVATVRIIDGPGAGRTTSTTAASPEHQVVFSDSDGMCDVLTVGELTAEVTELLITYVPSLTGTQIAVIRQQFTDLARAHGWLET